MKKKFSVFLADAGRVLLDYDETIAARRLAALTRMPPEEVYSTIYHTDLLRAYERGWYQPVEFFHCIRELLGIPRHVLDFRTWRRIFVEVFLPNPGIEDVLARIAPDVTQAILSNTNPDHWREIERTIAVVKRIPRHHQFLSFELGMRKPDPESFLKTARRLGITLDRIVFADDREENRAAFMAAGGGGVIAYNCHEDPLTVLKQGLGDCGILI